MTAVPRNDVVAFVAGSLAGESPLSVEDAVAAALRLLDEFDDHGWSIRVGDPRIEHDLAANEIRVEFGGVDLTPAFVAVGGAVYDVVPRGQERGPAADLVVVDEPICPDASEVITGAVAATLDYVSGWYPEEERRDLRARAEQVRDAGEEGWRSNACCPVCSEIVCDDDCPLYLVRDAAGCWVGSTGAVVECEIVDDEISSEPVEEPEVDEPAEEIETINDHMVGISAAGDRLTWLGSNGVSRETALRHAAWIVALVDPLDERFPKVLDAVRST